MNRNRWTLLACLTAVAIACLTLIAGAQDDSDWPKFSDVSDDHQSVDGVKDAYRRGWMNGYPDGTFRPDKHMSDRQIISVIGRMFYKTGGITRGQMADLITDWYPNLKWGNPEPCEQIPGWCVFLPISRQNEYIGIRFAVWTINWTETGQSGNIEVMTRFYNNEWIYPGEPGLVIPIGSVQEPDDIISVIVLFAKHNRIFQVNRKIYTGSDDCPDGRMACWGNETEICHTDGYAVTGGRDNCWQDISKLLALSAGGQKWPS